MASSSNAIPTKEKYDVFISFRGSDTRKTFSSHLHAALIRRKIDTYIDYRLEKGEDLEAALLKAIQQSKIYVVIFSENYASSTWCLKELCHIMECKAKDEYVIPVFYGIDPSDVRYQKRNYETAFAKHEQRLGLRDKLDKWKGTLTKAANLSGFDPTSKTFRDDSDLVEQVVSDVLAKLNREAAGNVPDNLVGVEVRIQSIIKELDIIPNDTRVRFVVLWGMGGIGKTTLADVVFHGLYSQFEACCFIANVRERSGAEGEISPQLYGLRDELLRQLLGDRDITIHTPSVDSYVKMRLNRMKVIVVLDDVNQSSQLEFLAGNQLPFGPGSRVVITTRVLQSVSDLQLLRKVDNCDVKTCKVDELNVAESMQFFDSNSLINSTKNSEILGGVLDYTAGVPLALKVLSPRFLQCKKQEDLELLWGKLRKFPDKKLQNVYKASYEGLQENEREIFLDIACFHKGKELCHTKRILAACCLFPDDGIQILIDRCVISLINDCIWMHDVIQEMGVAIVKEECAEEPGNRSRLHNSEDVIHVLKNNTGTAKVHSIYYQRDYKQNLTLHPQAFTVMRNLRFLSLRFVHVDVEAGLESLPNALKYMKMDSYPLKSLPSKFSPKNLVELHMPNSKLRRLCTEGQNPINLKTIDLSYSRKLVEVAFLSNCVNIESINLKGCTSLVQVPDLTKCVYIKSIDLRYCGKLVQVPDLSKSVNIESINLQSCENLETIPSYFQNFTKLTHLKLGCRWNNNTDITDFSSCLWKMKFLTHLDLSWGSMKKVPSLIECMTRIISVDLSNCTFLVSLPTNICKLKSLVRLDLSGCSIFIDFPEILEPMERLEHLSLSETNIEELPSSFGNLVGLKKLDLSFCCRLTSLPDSIYNLNLLEWFSLSSCYQLKTLALPFRLFSLTYLNLSHFTGVQEIPDCFNSLPGLQVLVLEGTMIETIPPTIKGVSGLKSLHLNGCKQLQSLPELPCLLEWLDARHCTSLMTVLISVTALTQGLNQILSGRRSEYHSFTGCVNLDTSARSNIMYEAHCRILRMATACNFERLSSGSVLLQSDGSEIPRWFNCRTEGPSIEIKLPQQWSGTKFFLGFALGVVYGDARNSYHSVKIRCKMILKNTNVEGHTINMRCADVFFDSDKNDVIVWYDKLAELPEETKCSTEASFDFSSETDLVDGERSNGVRMCGVSFLYADGQDDVLKFEVIHPQQVTRLHFDEEASASQVPGGLESYWSYGTETNERQTSDVYECNGTSVSTVPGDLESYWSYETETNESPSFSTLLILLFSIFITFGVARTGVLESYWSYGTETNESPSVSTLLTLSIFIIFVVHLSI